MAKRSDGTSVPVCRVRVPGTTVALLTYTSKMPGPSFSLPAGRSCPGKVVKGKGAICASCYAAKGMYAFKVVVNAQQKRFDWVTECMRATDGYATFVRMMRLAIAAECLKHDMMYFRIHDSGDMFSVKYIRAWTDIARALPWIHFWAPTRSYRIPAMAQALVDLNALPNVTVRPSALHFGFEPPRIPGLSFGSTADNHEEDVYQCPAHLQGNMCGDCRVCWDRPYTPVSYSKH